MAAKKRGAKPAPRPRSGFVTEEQRGTERLTLRLKPDVMALLYSLSTEIGEGGGPKTYAATIEAALHALDREMTAQDEENASATESNSNPTEGK